MGARTVHGSVIALMAWGLAAWGCSSETSSGGQGGGVTCGAGTVLDGGACYPVSDSSAGGTGGDTGPEGGAGTSGAAGTGGSGGGDAGAQGDAAPDVPGDAFEDVTQPECDGECGTPGCGTCPTLAMIAAEDPSGHKYEIDSLETSVGEYEYFLSLNVAKQTDDVCDWNDTYEPDPQLFLYPSPDMPIHAVDWCDAKAYCEWAGKRLCKGVIPQDPEKSEWHNACTLGGTRKYPYGNTFDETACPPEEDSHPVGSAPACEGGYPGLFDMVGSIWEWTDECPVNPTMGYCNLHGGAGISQALGCSVQSGAGPEGVASNVGFRCCR